MKIKEQDRIAELLHGFKRTNPTAQVIGYEIGDKDEPTPSPDGFWLKVITTNFGWLHVYQLENGVIEWF